MKNPSNILQNNPYAFRDVERMLLNEKGVRRNLFDDDEFGTILHRLIYTKPKEKRIADFIQWNNLFDLILQKSKECLTIEDANGLTPAMLACKLSLDLVIIKKLVGDIRPKDLYSKTLGINPINCVVARSTPSNFSASVIDFLIGRGLSPNEKYPETGWTPLIYATLMNYLMDIESLLKGGADLSILGGGVNDIPLETAIQIATRKNNVDVLKLLTDQKRT